MSTTVKTGWVLDVFAHQRDGLIVWMMMTGGKRFRLRFDLPITFYAAGPTSRLHDLSVWLSAQKPRPRLSRTERRDLFIDHPITLLAVEMANPADLPGLFQGASQRYPDITYYDADIDIGLRFAAVTGAYPLAYCQFKVDDDRLVSLRPIESPWDLDPRSCPLRILEMEPDCDPTHHTPTKIKMTYGAQQWINPIDKDFLTVRYMAQDIRRLDPDLILTTWGDTWMLPWLMDLTEKTGQELPLNREESQTVVRKAARTYASYGQIIYRGEQVLLYGRLHIDRKNAMLWGDYGLEGVTEVGRVTGLPIQPAARVSPGTGISSMQILTALRTGVLVPWHKQQAEREKTGLELIRSDQGGLVYQPKIGLHRDVGEIDFVSMYPGIMVRCNISPECTPISLSDPPPADPGLVPQTLAPLLKKRIALKSRLAEKTGWYSRKDSDKARSLAHKWLLVTCFGYLGYKNARFGRIESHEAVTANGREALMRAKETVEVNGFNVLQLYVDGLWVQKSGVNRPQDYGNLLDEIAERTGISIALDGIYRWVAFLPSRADKITSVPNRYFGVFQDGSIKTRGIEARRHDTAKYISDSQMEVLSWLAKAESVDDLPRYIPGALEILRYRLHELRDGRVPMERLIISQRLSRELDMYVTPSPAARAAMQLKDAGKVLGPGQKVRFVIIRGEPGVHAWDLPEQPDPRRIDWAAYRVLFLRAAQTILQPFGIESEDVEDILEKAATQPEFDLRVHSNTIPKNSSLLM